MGDNKKKATDKMIEADIEEAARRRAARAARKKKREQMRKVIIASMAVIAVLLVLLLALVISAIVKHVGGSSKDAAASETPATTETAASSETPSSQEPEATEEVSESGVVSSTEKGYLQVKLNNTLISDLTSLDTEGIGWGYGTTRDDENRPLDAVTYDETYAEYGAYFVQSGQTEKIIYLTMDEGYEYGYTSTILDVLQELDVQIVFFVTKPFVEENPDLVQRMIDEGHIVGNHSVTHPSDGLPSQTLEEQEEEVMGVHELMLEQFDYEMWLFRYPTGRFSEQSLALLNNLGYRSVFWSFAHYDYDTANQPDEAESLEKLLSSLHPGAIYLLHAVSETNTNILRDFIEGARNMGYTFELIPADGWRIEETDTEAAATEETVTEAAEAETAEETAE